jgi:hypothetical protein
LLHRRPVYGFRRFYSHPACICWYGLVVIGANTMRRSAIGNGELCLSGTAMKNMDSIELGLDGADSLLKSAIALQMQRMNPCH